MNDTPVQDPHVQRLLADPAFSAGLRKTAQRRRAHLAAQDAKRTAAKATTPAPATATAPRLTLEEAKAAYDRLITAPARSTAKATPRPAPAKREEPTVTKAEFRRRLGFSLGVFESWRAQGLLPQHDGIAARKEPGFEGKGDPVWNESTVQKYLAKLDRTPAR